MILFKVKQKLKIVLSIGVLTDAVDKARVIFSGTDFVVKLMSFEPGVEERKVTNSEIGKNESYASDIYWKVVRYLIDRHGPSDAKKNKVSCSETKCRHPCLAYHWCSECPVSLFLNNEQSF